MTSDVRVYYVTTIHPPEWRPHTRQVLAYTAADAIVQVNLELDKTHPRGKIESVRPLGRSDE